MFHEMQKTKTYVLRTSLIVLALIFALLIDRNQSSAQRGDVFVLIETTKGPIILRIYTSVPNTARNFIDLVQRGYYNGKTFHRVENWLIQGGCPIGNGQGNYVDPQTGQVRQIPLEINRIFGHVPGAVAMARSNNPNSASCQFYILKKQMPQLNGQYAIFGGVVRGMDTVNRIGIGDRMIRASIIDNNQNPNNSNTGEQGDRLQGDRIQGGAGGESGF